MLRDLRFAFHLLLKERWYSAVAIVALALGIGVNATVFTLVNAILIRGLPYQDSAYLYMLGSQDKDGNPNSVSPLDFQDWQRPVEGVRRARRLQQQRRQRQRRSVRPAKRARSASLSSTCSRSSPSARSSDGTSPPDDERTGGESVVLIGHAMWKSRYGEEPGILGKILKLDGKPATIIGVMPQGEQFPSNTELWTPLVLTAEQQKRSSRFLQVFGRLRPDASRRQAFTELNGIAARLAAAYPDTNKEIIGARVDTFNERFNGGKIRTVMLAMLGAVGFVLLIACANVANLQLSRSVHRSREVAVRIALGATRWRVIRQLLVESVLLGTLGGVLGLGLAAIGVRLFDRAVADVGKPSWIRFTMDCTVFAYLAAICVLTGVLFGLAPALQVTKTNVNEVLKEGGRGNAGGRRARWLTGTMVVLELALTLVLLVGAGLMIRSFLKLYTIDIGIRTENLVSMDLQLPNSKYPAPPAPGASAPAIPPGVRPDARIAFYDRLLPRLEAIAGVESRVVHDGRASVRGRPPRHRHRRTSPAQAGRARARCRYRDHQSAILRHGRRAASARTAVPRHGRNGRARRTRSSTRSSWRSSFPMRIRSAAASVSYRASRRRGNRPRLFPCGARLSASARPSGTRTRRTRSRPR